MKQDSYAVFVPDPGELPTADVQNQHPDVLEVKICIDTAQELPPLRPLHGVTNYTPLPGASFAVPNDLGSLIRALHVPCSYFHDDIYTNPGKNVIDVSRIFPLFHADENDPANYLFRETDDYLRSAVEDGVKIIYRLGESIEVGSHYRTAPPADFAKWTRIALNIVRHYTEGWANGFHWPMTEWAVWEEPNNPNLWHGDFSCYLELYKIFAPAFKKAFPRLHVGGPETTTLGYRYLEQFLRFVHDEKLPLDFVSYTAYYLTPAEMLSESVKRRRMLDEHGFQDVPLGTNEWHCSPFWYTFSDPVGYWHERQRFGGVEGAVFAAAVLCGLQDSPLDYACFYSTAIPGGYGLFDVEHRPTPSYYVFLKFAQLFQRSAKRLPVTLSGVSANTQIIASENQEGDLELFCGCFSQVRGALKLELPEEYELALAETISDVCQPHFAEIDFSDLKREGRTVILTKHECATAYYLKLKRRLKKAN